MVSTKPYVIDPFTTKPVERFTPKDVPVDLNKFRNLFYFAGEQQKLLGNCGVYNYGFLEYRYSFEFNSLALTDKRRVLEFALDHLAKEAHARSKVIVLSDTTLAPTGDNAGQIKTKIMIPYMKRYFTVITTPMYHNPTYAGDNHYQQMWICIPNTSCIHPVHNIATISGVKPRIGQPTSDEKQPVEARFLHENLPLT